MENPSSSFGYRFNQWLKQSLLMKLLSIGFLVVILMIPTILIRELINERQGRQSEAIAEVSRSWGPEQTVIGPVLTIPYTEWAEFADGKRTTVKKLAHFLPLELKVEGQVNHQTRKRGLYDVILYQSDLKLKGQFEQPDFQALHISPESVNWDEAMLSVGITGMPGIRQEIACNWNGQSFRMGPGTASAALLASGVRCAVPVDPNGKSFSFDIPIGLKGHEGLHFGPVGKTTEVALNSDWPSPSFEGAFLPEPRTVNADGFKANWKVLDLNRNFPQQWKDEEFKITDSTFGVRLIQPVDNYLKNTRTAKYAILVIGLTFLIFFFFETLRRFHIHPFQYLLVGLAITVFYLLLLSLSEHIGFDYAYWCATAATIALICVYSASVFRIRQLVFQLAALLGLIYTFIYIVLQLEDYALLAGSLGVFTALASVMWYSRKIDWYDLG